MHLNLPFANDREFFQLHAAIRFLLPLLPALAAASPVIEGAFAPNLDQRLAVYATNARLVPEVSGAIVPESARSRADYEDNILGAIYRALQPHDPAAVLREEWVNSRGAIARFERMAIEIRVLDAQESPRADLASAYLISETLRPVALNGHFTELDSQFSAERLSRIYRDAVHLGEQALVEDTEFLHAWGFRGVKRVSMREMWQELLQRLPAPLQRGALYEDARITVEQGPLARRIRQALGANPERSDLRRVYGQLCECLRANARFLPGM